MPVHEFFRSFYRSVTFSKWRHDEENAKKQPPLFTMSSSNVIFIDEATLPPISNQDLRKSQRNSQRSTMRLTQSARFSSESRRRRLKTSYASNLHEITPKNNVMSIDELVTPMTTKRPNHPVEYRRVSPADLQLSSGRWRGQKLHVMEKSVDFTMTY